MFKKLSVLFVIFTVIATVGCDPLQYGEDSEVEGTEPEGDVGTPDGSGNGDVTIDTITGIYVIDYVNDTCQGPEYSSDNDSLYVEVKDGEVTKLDMDDGAYEEVLSYKDNKISFNVKETEESEDYVACNVTFEGAEAKGMCDLTVGECALSYIKCTDDLEDYDAELACIKEACKNSMNPADCPADDTNADTPETLPPILK